MKTKITARSAALVALMSLIQMPHAHADDHTFTPLENLPPEQRQEISEKLNVLTQNIEIDWDSIVVGINECGQITFRNKDDIQVRSLGTFSCLAVKDAGNSEK